MKRSAALRPTGITRHAPLRRGRRRSKYSKRERHPAFMAFVKTLLCSVVEEWPDYPNKPTPCSGPIEADHDSRGRGLGQKSDDRSCIPMCTGHHRERTDHTGTFKHIPREQIRAWFSRAQLRTQTLWRERNGEVIA